NIEQKFFDLIGLGTVGTPDLSTTQSELDFLQTPPDSSRKLTVMFSNPGCDTLRIDTIFSTNPVLFSADARKFPVKIAPGRSISETVNFTPREEGEYLESLEIITNAGNFFISLRGTSKRNHT